ncbi:MAG: RNA polymerase sigma factor [Saprospiraceae bacterium]|nr:RNA polymerase sigma factor [Saprospiraceae bacterium]
MTSDKELIQAALVGEKSALEDLIKRHQDWVFNIALAFTGNHQDAADLSQEVLIKAITKLSNFKGNSEFRTWLYRIIKNHFLNLKRNEKAMLSFEAFAAGLDHTPNTSLPEEYQGVEQGLLVKEAKLSCMKGMLLCLTPEQRLVYIIGELLELPDTIGSDIMEISRANFRIKLHRVKKDLYSFMQEKCGLINKQNPCRCAKKTAGFIRQGYVDPVHLHFQKNTLATIDQVIGKKLEAYQEDMMEQYRALYQSHPFLKSPDLLDSIKDLLASEAVKDIFNLDGSNEN